MQPQQSSSATTGETAVTRPLRALLPATTPRGEPPPTQSKRARITLACAACRTRKTKCSGERPQCSECASRDCRCQYKDTEVTQTKRKHQDLEVLFELLKSLPQEDAMETLSRIRAGEEPRDIVETVTHGTLLMKIASELEGNKSSVEGSSIKSRRGSRSGGEDEDRDENENETESTDGVREGREEEPRMANVPTREKV